MLNDKKDGSRIHYDRKHRLRFFGPFALSALLASITTIGCRKAHWIPDDWQKQEQQELQVCAAQFTSENTDLNLHVSHVVALDDQTFLLGGSYRSPAASIRSALLRSVDGGKTWHDTGVWLTGSDTWRIFVLDKNHAHAVVNWSIEGWLGPFVIFRTSDGGATWQRSRQDLPFDHLGIPLFADLSFASPKHGQFCVAGSMGSKQHYITKDGGQTWKLTHTVSGPQDAPADCKYQRDWPNKKVHILYRLHEHLDYETVGAIDTEYTIDNEGNITPADG